jgi:hypothetical protein
MAEKKESPERQTKAGMMEKAGSEEDNERDKTTSKTDSENLPKTGKEEAENRDKDKPLH